MHHPSVAKILSEIEASQLSIPTTSTDKVSSPRPSMGQLAQLISKEYDADLLLYFGPIERPKDDHLIEECRSENRKKNLILIISTFGGSAMAAYRIARSLQKTYENGKISAYVNGVCASAGTLLLLGADELLLTEHAELGPIDAQVLKHDEIGSRMSGLIPIQGLEYLEKASLKMFARIFTESRFGGSFSTSTAVKIATDLTSGLMGRLYSQIDPMRLAEVNRAVQIAQEYGSRIERNLLDGALQKLLTGYPAHDFSIDLAEAKTLFKNITPPSENLKKFGSRLKPMIEDILAENQPSVMFYPLEGSQKNSTTPSHETPINPNSPNGTTDDRSSKKNVSGRKQKPKSTAVPPVHGGRGSEGKGGV